MFWVVFRYDLVLGRLDKHASEGAIGHSLLSSQLEGFVKQLQGILRTLFRVKIREDSYKFKILVLSGRPWRRPDKGLTRTDICGLGPVDFDISGVIQDVRSVLLQINESFLSLFHHYLLLLRFFRLLIALQARLSSIPFFGTRSHCISQICNI